MSTPTEAEARAALLARAATAPVIAVRFQQPEPIGRRHVAAVALAERREAATRSVSGALVVDVIEVLAHGVRIARVVPAGEDGAGATVSAILPWGSVRTLICQEVGPEAVPAQETHAPEALAAIPAATDTAPPARRRGRPAKDGAGDGEPPKST